SLFSGAYGTSIFGSSRRPATFCPRGVWTLPASSSVHCRSSTAASSTWAAPTTSSTPRSATRPTSRHRTILPSPPPRVAHRTEKRHEFPPIFEQQRHRQHGRHQQLHQHHVRRPGGDDRDLGLRTAFPGTKPPCTLRARRAEGHRDRHD